MSDEDREREAVLELSTALEAIMDCLEQREAWIAAFVSHADYRQSVEKAATAILKALRTV